MLVTAVLSDQCPVEDDMVVLTVPLLVLMLWWRTGFRRGETDTDGAFSLSTEARR
jgi:hypothetical protein